MIGESGPRDERAVSITVTHAMTISITTILIAGLLMSAGGLLQTETERSTETSLETVGERLAGEIQSVDRLATEEDGQVNVTADHPRTITNSGYTVELRTDCDSPLLEDGSDCVKLTDQGEDVTVHVPVETDAELANGSTATGGTIDIGSDSDEITIRRAN